MNGGNEAKRCEGSQSLWSRDGFLIQNPSKKPPMSGRRGRNPFGAGTVFQLIFMYKKRRTNILLLSLGNPINHAQNDFLHKKG